MSRATQQARIAQREADAATRRRRLGAATAVVAVLLVISAMVIAKASGSSSTSHTAAATGPAPATVTEALASVPASVFTTVGTGTAASPTVTGGAALTSGGKPELLFVGDEWCPYCAAERWGLAVALSRFGTFTGLGAVRSSASDVYPSTATLSFHGATYTSSVVAFAGYELQDAARQPLDTLPSDVTTTVSALSGGSVPFIDIGGAAVIRGASYDPAVLKGETQAQIAAALSDPTSPITQAVVGTADQITQQLCTLTGGQPASACAP